MVKSLTEVLQVLEEGGREQGRSNICRDNGSDFSKTKGIKLQTHEAEFTQRKLQTYYRKTTENQTMRKI